MTVVLPLPSLVWRPGGGVVLPVSRLATRRGTAGLATAPSSWEHGPAVPAASACSGSAV